MVLSTGTGSKSDDGSIAISPDASASTLSGGISMVLSSERLGNGGRFDLGLWVEWL